MELPGNITTYLKNLPLKNMSGHDTFVAVAFYLAGGDVEVEVEVKEIQASWSKGTMGKKYNSAYLTRAKGRIHPLSNGMVYLTEEGITYIQELMGEVPALTTTLLVFKQGNAHSFDKFLRDILKKATHSVDIADTYVSGVLFDTLLDKIPDKVPTRFIYENDKGDFVACAARFAKQYKFQGKESKQFHDRFLIIDQRGYIIGPSLKDAADKKPATVVALSASDSKKLIDLFNDIWKNAK